MDLPSNGMNRFMNNMEDLEMKRMSADERLQRYEFEKNQLLAAMKGHTADEIQRALKILMDKWRV